MIKFLKSVKKYEVSEFTTTNAEKLRTNFPNSLLDQYTSFKDGDKVTFLVGLAWVSKDVYFYQMNVAEKLERITDMKTIAG